MDEKKIAVIVPIIAALIIGGAIGVYFQFQKDAPKLNIARNVIKSLSSKTVPSIVAFGKASKIEGRNITLDYNGDTITIGISDDAQIYTSSNQTAGATPTASLLENIKIGDDLSVNLKVLPDGQLQGQSVIILNFAN